MVLRPIESFITLPWGYQQRGGNCVAVCCKFKEEHKTSFGILFAVDTLRIPACCTRAPIEDCCKDAYTRAYTGRGYGRSSAYEYADFDFGACPAGPVGTAGWEVEKTEDPEQKKEDEDEETGGTGSTDGPVGRGTACDDYRRRPTSTNCLLCCVALWNGAASRAPQHIQDFITAADLAGLSPTSNIQPLCVIFCQERHGPLGLDELKDSLRR